MKSTTRLGASSHWQLACLFNSFLTITWKDKRIVFVSIADARSTLCANNLAHYCLKHVLVCLQMTLLLSSLYRLDNNGHLNIFRSIVPSVCVRWSPLSWLSMWGKVFSASPFVSKIVDVFLLRRVSVIKSEIRTINLWFRPWNNSMRCSSSRGCYGQRWIPPTKASDAELWCFIRSVPE